MQHIKCLVIGDHGVGKTSMVRSYTSPWGCCGGEYIPTVFDNYSANRIIDGKKIELNLWDTHGQDDYDRLRPLSYPQTDVFIVCYCITSKMSMEHIKSKWIPEILHHCPYVPYMFVATKIDFRTDVDQQILSYISKQEGQEYAAINGACDYVECSALTQQGLTNVFEAAVRASFIGLKCNHLESKYKMFTNDENAIILRNRKYFHYFSIYDIYTFLFTLCCIFIDIVLEIICYLTWINGENKILTQFILYQLLILMIPIFCIIGLKYIKYFITFNKHKYLFLIIIMMIILPIIILISLFINIAFFMHRFILIKFPMSKHTASEYYNSCLWVDIFSIIKLNNNKCKKNILINTLLINQMLSRYKITSKMSKIEEYSQNELQQFVPFENIQHDDQHFIDILNCKLSEQFSSTSSLYKFLFEYVYNNLFIFDYKYYLSTLSDNDNFNRFFNFILYPIYIISQIGKLLICIIMHEYHFIFDVLFLSLIVLMLVLWTKYVSKFYSIVWRIGYNHKINATAINGKGHCVLILNEIDETVYSLNEIIIIKKSLIAIFGNDIAQIIYIYTL